jgi:hypothetical protein
MSYSFAAFTAMTQDTHVLILVKFFREKISGVDWTLAA